MSYLKLGRTTLTITFCLVLMSGLSACAQSDFASDDSQNVEAPDICEQAAEHHFNCTGDYITPPICDDTAHNQSQQMLAMSCDDYNVPMGDPGKADGAFCDWFGLSCTPDKEIFSGASCKKDSDCSGSSFCVEKKCFAGVGSAEFSATLDQFTESHEYSGSSVELIVGNEEIYQRRRDLMANAKHSLHFSALYINDDDSGHETIDDMIAAAARGVEVRVALDATNQYFNASYEMIKRLSDNGVKVIAFNPITEWASLRLSSSYWSLTANMRLHEKVLIIDGQEAIIGGRNVSDKYFDADGWRDVDAHVKGPGVAAIQDMFAFIWDRMVMMERETNCLSASRYGNFCPPEDEYSFVSEPYYPTDELQGPAQTRVIHSDPMTQETSHGYFTTLALIRGARHSVTISNAYFIPPRRLRKHLKAAAERGVDVTVITNSKDSTDMNVAYYAGINFHKELIESGVKIYLYNGPETLHSKAMMVDGELAVVGSYNLDPRSAIDNSETMFLIRNTDAVEQLTKTLQEDRAKSTRATGNYSRTEMAKARLHRIIEPML